MYLGTNAQKNTNNKGADNRAACVQTHFLEKKWKRLLEDHI